ENQQAGTGRRGGAGRAGYAQPRDSIARCRHDHRARGDGPHLSRQFRGRLSCRESGVRFLLQGRALSRPHHGWSDAPRAWSRGRNRSDRAAVGARLMTQRINIDRAKPLKDDHGKGHNRWHPDVPPVIEVGPMEEVTIETRDSSDGQIRPGTTAADLLKMDSRVVHPLTGPVFVKGAGMGDLLEIEYLDIVPQRHAWTRFMPGIGFLHDLFDHPYLVHWDLTQEWATSPSIPGVRIPNGAFMGTAGLAPSH